MEKKPVPTPRRALPPIPGAAASNDEEKSSCKTPTKLSVRSGHSNGNPDNASGAVPKPVATPRTIFQRLTSVEKKKSKNRDDVTSPLERVQINFSENQHLTDDAKRGTINLFKRNRSADPFDSEFEKNLQDGALLTDVTFASPLEDMPAESRSSLAFSTVSSSNSNSTSDDLYVDPPSNSKRVEGTTHSSDNSRRMSPYQLTPFPLPSPPPNLCGETNNCYLDTETTESVYEAISSYSSASSTTESTASASAAMNEYSPLPKVANTSSHSSKPKRNTVPIVGTNGHSGSSNYIAHDLVGAPLSKNRYERLQDDKLDSRPSSLSGTDDKLESLGGSNRSSLNNSASSHSNLTRNASNSSTNSNKRSTPPHEYDDVAMENGNIVFLDNQMNTPPATTNSNSSIASRNSVVMEFDPLFIDNSNISRHKTKERNASLIEEPPHRYEYVGDEMDGKGTNLEHKNSKRESPLLALTPTLASNPEYFPMQMKRDSPSEKNKARQESGSDDEFEPVGPIIDILSKLRKSQSPPSDSGDRDSTDNGQKTVEEASSGNAQGGFLRRLSHKMRLGPIREEVNRSIVNTSTASIVIACNKCFEEHVEGTKCKFNPIVKPDIVFSSNLYKPSGIKKEFTKRFGVLSQGKLAFQNDKSVVLEEIMLDKVGAISRKEENKIGTNQQELQPFVLHFVSGKNSNLTLACPFEAQRCSWMQKYIETFCSGFPSAILSSYDRGGWCFMKEGLTNKWNPCWFILKERVLYYNVGGSEIYVEMDLRKARSIVLTSKDGDHMCPFVENSDILSIDINYKIYYVQTENSKLTAGWTKAIQEAAKRNGPEFDQMQLTTDNVPVIVDKCIDFLYAHGTLAEGIYRQSGANSRITLLLSEFQKDAWAVQISPKEFSAHDVAGTLKRFFRTLPEPLVTAKLYEDWIKTSAMKNMEQKLEAYERLLEDVPIINYNILKKLICHLYAVHELHEKNLMPLINLAPIWGPTLMNVDSTRVNNSTNPSYKGACTECEVVKDLIENYYTLFRIDESERDKEKKMQDALENFHLGSAKRKCSGDMKMWIYILEKDDTSAINITLTPSSTACSIAQQLCKMRQIRNCENLFLYEVICESALQRPLHPSEKVIETVLRWSIWDIEERKNNYLILRPNTLYPDLVPHAKDPKALYGDLKFVDSKSKTFKKYTFTFGRAMLKYYKDAKASVEVGSWKIEDIVWYLGAEQKRTPPTKWSFTFVKKNYPFKRSKDEPFFGNVVSCASEEEMHTWIGAMVVGEHPAGLYPSVLV